MLHILRRQVTGGAPTIYTSASGKRPGIYCSARPSQSDAGEPSSPFHLAPHWHVSPQARPPISGESYGLFISQHNSTEAIYTLTSRQMVLDKYTSILSSLTPNHKVRILTPCIHLRSHVYNPRRKRRGRKEGLARNAPKKASHIFLKQTLGDPKLSTQKSFHPLSRCISQTQERKYPR